MNKKIAVLEDNIDIKQRFPIKGARTPIVTHQDFSNRVIGNNGILQSQ